MRNQVWQKAIESCADPARARRFFEQLKGASAPAVVRKASADQARVVAALFGGSQALGHLLLKHPDWIGATLDMQSQRHPQQ